MYNADYRRGRDGLGSAHMKITWLGHAAFLIEDRERILIDPFISDNPTAKTSPDEITCDVICVTHGHSDHLGDTIRIANKNGAKVLTIVELADLLQAEGVDAVGFNIGGSVKIGGTKVTMTPAMHSCGAPFPGREGCAGAPAGFVIECGKRIYHAGDTALFGDMALIGSMHSIDVAMLPIGGFFTMDERQAAMAAELLRPKIAIPMHYNTWPPISADPQLFKTEVAALSDADVRIMNIGETINL